MCQMVQSLDTLLIIRYLLRRNKSLKVTLQYYSLYSYRKMNSAAITIVLMLIPGSYCIICDSIPRNVTKPKQNNEMNKYQIMLQGNPKGYVHEQRYKGKSSKYSLLQCFQVLLFFSVTLFATYGQPTFKKYTITAEPANNVILDVPTGRFEIAEESNIFSKFSTNCPNTVVESNLVPKTQITVSI